MREGNFPETREQCAEKMLGKNRREKCEKSFLYSHEYREQKIGTKKMQETIFPETHESAS